MMYILSEAYHIVLGLLETIINYDCKLLNEQEMVPHVQYDNNLMI